MTILELIEKLKEERGLNGYYHILNDWLCDYNHGQNQCFDKIIGFLYGLRATGYLSDDDFNSIFDSL